MEARGCLSAAVRWGLNNVVVGDSRTPRRSKLSDQFSDVAVIKLAHRREVQSRLITRISIRRALDSLITANGAEQGYCFPTMVGEANMPTNSTF